MVLVQKEIKKICMCSGKHTDYSSIQGPCPSGYHIPTRTEITNMFKIGEDLGARTPSNIDTSKLKLPLSGQRANNGTLWGEGQQVRLQCLTNLPPNYPYYIVTYLITNLTSSGNITYTTSVDYRAYGMPIRPFKNVSVVPTNSGWTSIHGTIGGAGIFHNSSLGLISLSSDNVNRVTIADKNLGATQVRNSGDTISDSNAGKLYQRGNNYGFSRTGTITTSSTQVDASSYGPGNYYSSSTFITSPSSPYTRDSSNNQNLWGLTDWEEGKTFQIRPITKVTIAGVYHNAELGLISLSSNGTSWTTIADKNLGATSVYNYGDTLTEANCGKFYQRGNNYGFPRSGPTSISSTRVNTSNYSSSNYYSSSTFITGSVDWSNPVNSSLRGGNLGTNDAMKGPCPSGFHIPKKTELEAFLNVLSSLFDISSQAGRQSALNCIKMSGSTGYISNSGQVAGAFLYIWGSEQDSSYTDRGVDLELYPGFAFSVNKSPKASGFSIRPFRNLSVTPDSTWTVVYQPS